MRITRRLLGGPATDVAPLLLGAGVVSTVGAHGLLYVYFTYGMQRLSACTWGFGC